MNPAMMMEGPRKRQKRDGARWSRSGCLTCKKRRKRCDEAKPSCHNCARLGRVCEGYSSLWAEPLNPSTVSQQTDGQKRRKLSSSPVSSTTRTPDSGIDIVSPSPNLLDDNDVIPIDNHSHLSSSSSSTSDITLISSALILTPTIRSNPTLTSTEAHYLQYHIEQGSKLLANLENHDNPLRALLVPRALASPLVMKATCAMSAMHFANRAHDGFVAKTAATRYYIRTVRELRGALEYFTTGTPTLTSGDGDGNSNGSGTIPDDLILAVGLLCKYEIVRGSVKQWAVHLEALRKLFAARGKYTALDSEAVQFLWGFFTYTHNVAKVTNRRYRYISADATSDVDLDVDVDVDIDGMRIRKLDIYIGYTEDILKLCARIADLPTLDRAGLDVEVANINHALQTWTPTPPSKPYILPRGFTPGARTRLQAVAECFRDAAYIYLHSVLERRQVQSQFQVHSPGPVPESQSQSQSESESESDPGLVLLSLSITKQQALDRCLNRISLFLSAGRDTTSTDNYEDEDEFTICPRHCEYSALTFPLFIAGCECRSEMQMGIVASALGRLEVGFGIGNVKRVKEVLGVLWVGEDCDGRRHWLDVLEDLGWELIVA